MPKSRLAHIDIMKISVNAIHNKFNKTKCHMSLKQKSCVISALIKINEGLAILIKDVPSDCLE